MSSWTGGASIDPSTGVRGASNRYHTPGAFDNFKFADLFSNDRWKREQMVDPHTGEPMFRRSGEPMYTNYYMPRQPKKDVTETLKIGDDGKRTETIVSKYVENEPVYGFRTFDTPSGNKQFMPNDGAGYGSTRSLPPERLADIRRQESRFTPARFMDSTYAEEGPAMASYAPPTMRGRFAEEGPGMGYRGPVRTTGNPFGYPMRTEVQGPPRYTDVNQEMQGATPMMPMSNARNFTPMTPIDQRTSEQTFAYNMVPLVRPEITPITTQRVPQGNTIPPSGFNQQSQLNRFPDLGISPVGGMTDAMKRRMLELFLSGDEMRLERSD